MTDDRLDRAVTSALRAAIGVHGAITPELIGSAAKRIVGQLRAGDLLCQHHDSGTDEAELPPPSRLVYFEDIQPGMVVGMVVQRFFQEPDPAALNNPLVLLTGGGHRRSDEWATVLERRERADVVSLIVVRPNGDQEWMYGSSLSALRVRADQ